mmetsp:Transcript_10081/g.14226  ORF Transcript_10081/g.14226 Transcript_10081/m.14226 type:complete len:266 (-) Transcript_10081:14-811(-)
MSDPPITNRGLAFVIGIDTYDCDESIQNLSTAARDATMIAEKLSMCGYKVTLTINENKKEIEEKFDEFKINIFENNYIDNVIYFAGHGCFNNKAQHILFSDFKKTKDKTPLTTQDFNNNLRNYAFNIPNMIEDITDLPFGTISNRTLIVLLDCCRLEFVPSRGEISSNDVQVSHSLKNECVHSRDGVLLGFSCGMFREAFEKEKLGGNYTSYMLEHLFKENRPVLFQLGEISKAVVNLTKNRQHPEILVNFPQLFTFALNNKAKD